MAIGGIQAFIFALLTILYFGFAVSGTGTTTKRTTRPTRSRKRRPRTAEKVAVQQA